MQMLAAKAAVSKNPAAMVPAPSSKPEFFINHRSWPYHQPAPKPNTLIADMEILPVQKIGKVPVARQSVPMLMIFVSNGHGGMHYLGSAGLN